MTSRDFHSEDAKRECARAALALTALFDSEADENDSLLAQAHLESCARCAWLLQSWTRSRYLLRRLPVPEVPPGLLMRVLFAVRLMSFSKRGAGVSALSAIKFEPEAIETRDARLLAESFLLSGVNPFAPRRPRKAKANAEQPRSLPPLDPALPQPPANLHALILERTIGSAPPQSAPVVVASEEFEVVPKVSRKPLRAVSKSFNAALLPIAAAWLFLLARAPQWTAPVHPTAASSEVSALKVPEPGETRLLRQPVSSPISNKQNREVMSGVNAVANTSPERLPAPNASRFVSLSLHRDDAPVMETSEEVSVATPSVVPKNQPVSAPDVSPAVRPQPLSAKVTHFAPAVSIAPVAWGARQANWSAPNVSMPDQRAAQWHGAARHAMPPAELAEGREEADAAPDDAPDAAEILDHVARLTDSRPDDVRDVMDDFRSELLASTDDAPAPADVENG